MSIYRFTSRIMMPLESSVRFATASVEKKRSMRVIHEALKVFVEPLQEN